MLRDGATRVRGRGAGALGGQSRSDQEMAGRFGAAPPVPVYKPRVAAIGTRRHGSRTLISIAQHQIVWHTNRGVDSTSALPHCTDQALALLAQELSCALGAQ